MGDRRQVEQAFIVLLHLHPSMVRSGILPERSSPIHTKKQLDILLATGFVQAHRLEMERGEPELPDPPIPDIHEIQAIRTPQSLLIEGEVQSNCAASLLPDIVDGHLFLYRVIHPERATLSIRKRSGKWDIYELEAERNQAVSDETRKVVQKWLEGRRRIRCT
jgi:hypothetical protein